MSANLEKFNLKNFFVEL